MPDSPRGQRDVALDHVDALIRRGRELQESAGDLDDSDPRLGAVREWQQRCAAAIQHLSGGRKAHWLSRAFSDAFLIRSIDGGALVEAPPAQILQRLIDVLMQARRSLLQMDEDAIGDVPDARPEPSRSERFGFVHRRELQPVLERAYVDSRAAFDRGDTGDAFVLSCTVLDAIVTDALEHAARSNGDPAAVQRVVDMPFDARIGAAERAGLIGGGCARLPRIALRYRDLLDDAGVLRRDAIVLARDARVTAQVLRIVIRDLDPGR